MNKPSHEYCKECKDWNGNRTNCFEICGIPIDIMEEWEKYRAIGTVEECRAAVEKQKEMKPKLVTRADGIIKFYPCPGCSSTEKYEPVYPKQKYCVMCGQKLDWSEE